MTISDFLQKYKIVIMYLNFWHYYYYNIWAPAPEELSARPCCAVSVLQQTGANIASLQEVIVIINTVELQWV